MLYNVSDLFNFLEPLAAKREAATTIETLNALSDELGKLGERCKSMCGEIDVIVDNLNADMGAQ